MTKGDHIVERGADFLEELARKAASEGGFAAKLAEPLADDAEFLRKLKPTLVLARLRGEPPPDGSAEVSAHDATEPARPQPQSPPRPETENENGKSKENRKSNDAGKSSVSGSKAILVAAAAFGVGIFVAKLIDWRGHAHPKV